MLEIRKNFERFGNLKGIAGSIRDVNFNPNFTTLAAVGLDRFLHVFDSKTRKSVIKLYIKQRQNRVLFSKYEIKLEEENEIGVNQEVPVEEEDDGGEDPWEILPTVEEKISIKKK